MNIDTSDTFGFEIFQKLYHDEIQKKEDALILFIHWFLVKYGLKCISIENENTFNASDKGSELLPKNWNANSTYQLHYIKDGKLYILFGVKTDADLLINFVKAEGHVVSNIQFYIEGTVSVLHGPLENIIPSYEITINDLQKRLISPIFPTSNKEVTTQTESKSDNEHEIPRSSSRRRSPEEPSLVTPPRLPQHDPARVGVADLYPGGRGGGMIFDPFSNPHGGRLPSGLGIPGRLPPGARPPGARFDPFGPPDLDPPRPHRRRPDDDHLPPPGFYDDMFM